jgi:RNA polymerase sigma-70 factor (ECF subfamily)
LCVGLTQGSVSPGRGILLLSESDIAALYAQYGHAIYKRCLRLVSSPEDARELMQETFFQFFSGRDRFLGKSSPFTFLYRIATNLSIDKLRRRTTAGPRTNLDDEPTLKSEGQSQEKRTQVLEEIKVLTEGLDEETLTIAVMSHVDGLTQDEIAETLGLSRKTIGKKLQRFMDITRDRAGVKV